MAAIPKETSDQQLLVMHNQYKESISNALQQLYVGIVATDPNSPEAKRQQDEKKQNEILFDAELTAFLRLKQIRALLKQRDEALAEAKELSSAAKKHREYYEEEEEEMEALAKLNQELSENERQQQEKLKHELEQAMKELNEHLEENQKFISYITKTLEESKVEFLNNYSENMKTQLLEHFHHEDGHIQFQMGDEQTASVHVDQIISALRQAAEEEYRKISDANQVVDPESLKKNVAEKMRALFGEHFANHPEAAKFTQQTIESVTKNVSHVVLDKGGSALQKALDVACVGHQQLACAQVKQQMLAACKQSMKAAQQNVQKPGVPHEKVKRDATHALSLAAQHGPSKGAEATQEHRKFSKLEALAKRLAAQQAAQARPALEQKAENCAQLRKS